jgi:hypothetical protein
MATTPPPAATATLEVAYPDRPLDRLTSALRMFTIIPIAIVLGTIGGGSLSSRHAGDTSTIALNGTGLLFLPPLLLLVFRRKYPRWWFEFNRELVRFGARVAAYAALLTDRYPSTDERQDVAVELPEPDAATLNRWLPLVKWFLAIPHYIVLFFLWIAAFVCVVIAWFAILFTGRYPEGLFHFVEGVLRWGNRVTAYAFLLITDRYPPFSLS